MAEGAVLCVGCGFNTKTGKKLEVKASSKTASNEDEGGEGTGGAKAAAGKLAVVITAGGVAALAGSGVWAGIGIATGFEVGWVAWGIGGLVGAVMVGVAKEQSDRLGFAAAGMALAGLLFGKVLLVQWGGTAELAQLMKDSPLVYEGAIHERMRESGEIDAELLAYLDGEEYDPDAETPMGLREKHEAYVEARGKRVQALTEGERDGIVKGLASQMVGAIPMGEKVKMTMSPFDALWFFLALGTAWKIASGGGDD